MESTRVAVLNRTPNAFDTEEVAAEWVVRLDADSSAPTLASWAQWLREDTRHHAAYMRVEKGWRQAECLKGLRPIDGTVRADLLDGIVGAVHAALRPEAPPGPARLLRRSSSARQARTAWPWRALTLSRLPSPYSALAVALGAGALASLLVLAGWRFLVTTP